MGAISQPSNCSRGDAVHLWKATCVRKCLSSRLPGDLPCTQKKHKTCEMSPDWWCSLTQLYFTISLVGLGADHSLLLDLSPQLPSVSPFSFDSINFFSNLIFFPSVPLHQPPSHPSPHSHIHLLSSQRILTCYCFSFRLGRPVFTNGLLPADQCFILSCINYWSSRMESGRAE